MRRVARGSTSNSFRHGGISGLVITPICLLDGARREGAAAAHFLVLCVASAYKGVSHGQRWACWASGSEEESKKEKEELGKVNGWKRWLGGWMS